MSAETHGAQADTATAAPTLPADRELVVDATYQQGVLTPHHPLDLPDGTPVRLHVTPLLSPAPGRSWKWPGLTRYIAGLSAWERLVLAIAGLLLAWSGQRYFHERLAFTWEGLLLALGGLALLVLALAGLKEETAVVQPQPTLAPPITLSPRRRTALLLATGCIGLLLFALASEPPWPSYTWGFVPWLGAIGLYLLALTQLRRPQPRAWPTWWYANRWLALAVAALVAVALGLRLWNIGDIPPTLGGDEGSQGLEALKILKGEITNPFSTGWLGVPTMSFYFNAPTIWLMGNTMEALRLPWALVGTATVLATFLLVRHLHGNLLALLTAALLAGYHYHIHYSRLGSNQVADALFVALALLFLYRGYDRRSPLDWALCGMVVGVAQFFYAGARFTAIIVIITTAFLALRDGRRFWREQRWGMLALLGAGLLAAAPMIQYAVRFPDAYNARLGMVGIVQSGWLERELVIRNQGVLPILLDQFVRAAFAFTAYPDRTVWYGSPRPLLLLEEGTLFLLGFGLALLRMFNRRFFPIVA
ncbi:MAG: glycosyltransferase family 39 protein, partial [Chloroflexaceae bacterium]|nr:glycosyltransferase family 39 protein [Chloroflexaceae bacterium]